MGDQIGHAVEGTLYYVDKAEFDRITGLNIEAARRTGIFANVCRINALYMIANAGSGHIGSSFSGLDILSWLYLNEMREEDVYFSSKGHDAPALYSVLLALGRLPYERIHALRRLGGLPGHPDVSVPGVVVNSGSLGMGISKAKGMVLADRLEGRRRQVFVLTGDGELQEGQIWESLVSAANSKMGEITAIVDHNKLQSDLLLTQTSDLGDLVAKFTSFDWHVERIDGHNITAFAEMMPRLSAIQDRPKLIVADTVKGRGVSFMEGTAMDSDAEMYRFHSGAPDGTSYRRAVQELLDSVNQALMAAEAEPLRLETREQAGRPPANNFQKLIPAYSQAILEQGRRNPKLVALDADLVLDTGLIPFKQELPSRFVECGIAEQDMVSQAGGLALRGYLPVAHSFACFLSTRPNEQIYTNATEGTKVVYVGALAGVLPGGPGHSHQSVRDISALAAVPGLLMAEPCCEAEVGPLVDYCLNGTRDSAYIRLVSIPYEVPFALPSDTLPKEGQGHIVLEGRDAMIIGSGPVLLSEGYRAAIQLRKEQGLSVGLIALPWLNRVDASWLNEALGRAKCVFTLDNHYVTGGQGEIVLAALARAGWCDGRRFKQFGLGQVPVCGTNAEVLEYHGLDAASLAREIGLFAIKAR